MKDVQLPVGEKGNARQEGAARVFLDESGSKNPKTKPLRIVNDPMMTNNQNHPDLPPTPRM